MRWMVFVLSATRRGGLPRPAPGVESRASAERPGFGVSRGCSVECGAAPTRQRYPRSGKQGSCGAGTCLKQSYFTYGYAVVYAKIQSFIHLRGPSNFNISVAGSLPICFLEPMNPIYYERGSCGFQSIFNVLITLKQLARPHSLQPSVRG